MNLHENDAQSRDTTTQNCRGKDLMSVMKFKSGTGFHFESSLSPPGPQSVLNPEHLRGGPLTGNIRDSCHTRYTTLKTGDLFCSLTKHSNNVLKTMKHFLKFHYTQKMYVKKKKGLIINLTTMGPIWLLHRGHVVTLPCTRSFITDKTYSSLL